MSTRDLHSDPSALTDAQIDALMPAPDGVAEADKTPVVVCGMPGYDFTEVAAWSAPLVRETVRSAVAADREQVKRDREVDEIVRRALASERDLLLAFLEGLAIHGFGPSVGVESHNDVLHDVADWVRARSKS